MFLLLLSAIAALGSIISQQQSVAFYEYRYGAVLANILIKTGITDIYHSVWFVSLGILLAMLILFCTLRRLKGKNPLAKIGSLMLHFSFVIIILGALIGAATGVREDITLAPGEKVTLTEGALAGAEVTVEDFEIEWYDNGMASQYFCDLIYKTPDGDSEKAQISVNDPFRIGTVKIYQELYGWQVNGSIEYDDKKTPFSIKEGEDVPLGDDLVLATVFVANFNPHAGTLDSMTQQPLNPTLVAGLEDDHGITEMVYLKPGSEALLGGRTIKFDSFVPYSGLRVKRDAGIPIVFVGFVLSVIGLGLRFIPHKERR